MIGTPTRQARDQDRQAARAALARLLAKSLFEEWLAQNAHLMPGDAAAQQPTDVAMLNRADTTEVQP